MIPAQHHQKILDGARREEIALEPQDFFALPPGKAPVIEPPPKKKRQEDVIVLVSGIAKPFAYLNGERVDLDHVKRHIRDVARDAA